LRCKLFYTPLHSIPIIMNKTLFTIRTLFLALCVSGSWLVAYINPEYPLTNALLLGTGLGTLVILTDIMLEGFSLRGLTAITFGLAVGSLVAYMISASPLFEHGDPETLFISRLALFLSSMYLSTVIALRGKDEFSLVIPYIRFTPQKVDTSLAVVDTSALMDGRILSICASQFMKANLIVPQFVIDELKELAQLDDTKEKTRAYKGLETLGKLKAMPHISIKIHESDLDNPQQAENKIIFVAQSLKANLLTTDYNLGKMAEFHGIFWLNINDLAKSLNPEISVGEQIEVKLVKPGKEDGQAIGYMNDGSMVVVNGAGPLLHQTVNVEIISILPSGGGKMIFAQLPCVAATA